MIKQNVILLAMLAMICAFGLNSCSDDDNDGDAFHCVEGTTYAYDAKIKSTKYEPIEYSYPNPTKPQGQGEFTYNDNTFKFTVDYNNNITVSELVELKNTTVIIPAYIDERTVTIIGKKLFQHNKDVKEIVFPCTVAEFQQYCITGASNAHLYIPDVKYSTKETNLYSNPSMLTIYKVETN